jgi:hypothetical protein
MSRAVITPNNLRHICFSMRQYHDMQFFILWVYITQVMGCSMGLQIFVHFQRADGGQHIMKL